MVTDALIEWLGGVMDGLLGVFPVVEVPAWLASTSAVTGLVFGYANSMGVWFPAGLAATVAGAIIAAWGVAFAIKGTRIAVSHFTGGGGSAS